LLAVVAAVDTKVLIKAVLVAVLAGFSLAVQLLAQAPRILLPLAAAAEEVLALITAVMVATLHLMESPLLVVVEAPEVLVADHLMAQAAVLVVGL